VTASLRPFSLPLETPLETAGETLTRREGFLLRYSEGGTAGVGEAAPLGQWTEPFRECEIALRRARDALSDGDETEAREAVEGRPAAAHALDCALLDRSARRADRPLYRYLGTEETVGSIPVNAVVGDADIETTVSRAKAASTSGFECVKVKVGARAPERDLERLSAVRQALGDQIALRADANGAWTESTARDLWPELGEIGVETVEQPLAASEIAGHAVLRTQRGPEVALDEGVREHGIDALLDAGAADVIILKPMSVGGIEATVTLTRQLEDTEVSPIITTTVDAAVARAAAVHVAATLQGPRPCGLATASRLGSDVAPDPAPVSEGRTRVPQTGGHGARPWSDEK
jgi:o-succinylbenzoate synthase